MKEQAKKPSIESTLKSLDTEEFIDIHFYRPIGYYWALFFHKLGVSPNAITIASIFIGIAAGICFYFQDLTINILGMLLLIWANSYDSADGQLARMTRQSSPPLGRILDGFCGDLWFISIYAAICFCLTPEWGIRIWILAAVTGFFHSKQAAMADYYRNVHLLFLKGKSGSELPNSVTLKENYKTLSWKKDFIYKLFETFYINYTVGQEQLSPKFQQLMHIIREKYHGEAPEWFRKAFREKSLPLMKYTNMLSFNTRVIVLFISLFIGMPWIYFVFEMTVLNAMLIYMIATYEKFPKQFTQELMSSQN
ncbi:MAG: CDP-alcohol phosphatidyltransferase family protein [Tannerellaceae bacterium]|nr:CDP-alcohol phosphatidyltransferase family protein [Tannerellaceae bacterium]